jgi:hypothetical protein
LRSCSIFLSMPGLFHLTLCVLGFFLSLNHIALCKYLQHFLFPIIH